jgi:hypothetical protein
MIRIAWPQLCEMAFLVPVRLVVNRALAGGSVNHNASRPIGQASWVSEREAN